MGLLPTTWLNLMMYQLLMTLCAGTCYDVAVYGKAHAVKLTTPYVHPPMMVTNVNGDVPS